MNTNTTPEKEFVDISTEAKQSISNLKRQFKQQAILNISILFVIPGLLFGIFQMVNY